MRPAHTVPEAGEPAVDLPAVDLPAVEVSARDWREALEPGGTAEGPEADVPDAVALVLAGDRPGPRALEVAARYGIDLVAEVDGTVDDGTDDDAVRTLALPRTLPGVAVPWSGLPARLLTVRAGDRADVGLRLGRALAGRSRAVVVLEDGVTADAVPALAGGIWLDSYRLPTSARRSPGPAPVRRVEILTARPAPPEAARLLEVTREVVTATHRARALTATRSTVKNPAWMAAAAQHLVDSLEPDVRASLTVDVQDARRLAERGAGAILAVGAGSPTPPRLVTVTYTPTAGTGGRRVALVGKGITFDTGGISKKPTDGMLTMSTDMAGSAVVLATVLAAAQLRLPHTVTATLPLAENAFGGGSYRPGDVVRTLSGLTVEVGNTDAEGRLVLADGLTHVIGSADPEIVVDVATLTGAAKIALGTGTSALFASDDALADALSAAGDAAGEKVWRLPMPADSEAALASDVADVGQTPRGDVHAVGGTIFAAMFLRRFTQGRTWAHLDIAGTGRSTGGPRLATGAPTGVGAALLVRWLSELV